MQWTLLSNAACWFTTSPCMKVRNKSIFWWVSRCGCRPTGLSPGCQKPVKPSMVICFNSFRLQSARGIVFCSLCIALVCYQRSRASFLHISTAPKKNSCWHVQCARRSNLSPQKISAALTGSFEHAPALGCGAPAIAQQLQQQQQRGHVGGGPEVITISQPVCCPGARSQRAHADVTVCILFRSRRGARKTASQSVFSKAQEEAARYVNRGTDCSFICFTNNPTSVSVFVCT